MSANKIHQIWLLLLTFFSSCRPLFLHRLIFSPSPLSHIPLGPLLLCSLYPPHWSNFCALSPLSSKIPLEAQIIFTLSGTTLSLCQFRRSPQLKSSSPILTSMCVTRHPQRSQVCSSVKGDGDFSDPKAGQSPALLAKQSYFSPCLPLGCLLPLQASPLGTHVLSELNRETPAAPNHPELHGKMDKLPGLGSQRPFPGLWASVGEA